MRIQKISLITAKQLALQTGAICRERKIVTEKRSEPTKVNPCCIGNATVH